MVVVVETVLTETLFSSSLTKSTVDDLLREQHNSVEGEEAGSGGRLLKPLTGALRPPFEW